MSAEAGDTRGQRLRFEGGAYSSLSELAANLAENIARQLACDVVLVTLTQDDEAHVSQFPRIAGRDGAADGPLFEVQRGTAVFRGQVWALPFVVKDLQRARVPNDLSLELTVRKVRSYGAFPLMQEGRLVGVIECYFTRAYHRWHPEEVTAFEDLSRTLVIAKPSGKPKSDGSRVTTADDLRSQYMRMARYGNLIIMLTDAQFGITEVFGNIENIIGISAGEMRHNPKIWEQIIDPRDQASLRRRILRMRLERDELQEEVRVVHQRTGEVRWMMLRALPQFSANGTFLGWEGFGIDITDRRGVQEALANQSARVEALFEVSRALQGQTDPAVVVLRGLKAVLKATNSMCGYGCFYHSKSDEVEVVAAQGLSERYLDNMGPVLKGTSILRAAIAQKAGCRIDDLQRDPLAHIPLAKIEDIRSAIVMPLVADDEVYGALVLFTRDVGTYSLSDYELVLAAATQIALAVRQTYMFEKEREHNQSLSALYRISHELSKYRTPREMADQAFPILQQEFTLKRAWFGVLNEQGTHLIGQAGFGVGLKRQLQEVQVELTRRHEFLDEALRTQQPVVVRRGSPMQCDGLQRVVEALKLDTIAIVPLVSLGQVVGVLIVEPSIPHSFVSEERLQLLSSMANEMATILMARRFESKMAEALKMRMAGLLASGVAHNFNNLLQAILGQVSLIELQLPKGAASLESTKTIAEAAKRGASLVSQLLSFATQNGPSKQITNLGKMITDSQELYRSLLGKRIELRCSVSQYCADATLDPSQVQQVITNLLANAKDAIGKRDDGAVVLSVSTVRLRAGEIDPELSPGNYLRVDVKDNGIGMDSEQQARCFEPFYTTKNVDRGTGVGLTGSGLGLSAAYSIVKQHGGSLTVSSVVDEGATFSLYLPSLSPAEDTAIGSSPRKADSQVKGGVLLLGLEPGAQPFVGSVFESLGYRSRSAFDVAQVSDLISRDPSKWGFLLIDADTVSDEVLKSSSQLLSRFEDLRILVMSATGRGQRAALPQSPRVAAVDKPLGVWNVEAVLQRLSHSIAVEPAME